MTHVISQIESPQQSTIDRQKIVPMLCRIFCSQGRHNPVFEYERGQTPSNELQIYTWKDCTLRELANLIKDVNPESRKKGVEFRFAFATPHARNPRFVMTDIGNVVNGQRGPDDTKTLGQCSYVIGDYIDVAIVPPAAPYRNGGDRTDHRRLSSGGYGGRDDRSSRRFGSYRD
ncbi:hypothetical protein M3Y95_00253900 [Aphelenchoides besseyi]|nr:hypothetical protein M3Y95_00253900 [Aphelenchoides besseyi]